MVALAQKFSKTLRSLGQISGGLGKSLGQKTAQLMHTGSKVGQAVSDTARAVEKNQVAVVGGGAMLGPQAGAAALAAVGAAKTINSVSRPISDAYHVAERALKKARR